MTSSQPNIKAGLGFIFTPDFSQVLLIEKQRPAWQKGKLNGLGGKLEIGETFSKCLSREVKEEAGLYLKTQTWHPVGKITWDSWRVQVFACCYVGDPGDAISLTDEKVAWYDTSNLPKNIMSNLAWLIPLAQDCLTNSIPPKVFAKY